MMPHRNLHAKYLFRFILFIFCKNSIRLTKYYFIFNYIIYLTANNGRPEPGVPSAGTSCYNMIAKSQHIEAKKYTLIKQ